MKAAKLQNEENVLASLKSGSPQALSIIYNHYFESLFLFAYQILKDQAIAEDIVQELFIDLWQKRSSHNIASLKNYLYTANRYQIIKAIRKNQNREKLFEDLEIRIWGPADAENLLFQKELQARLLHITAALPPKCREIYKYSREELLTNQEIAHKLGISVKTVENQITIALRKIRSSMEFLLLLYCTL